MHILNDSTLSGNGASITPMYPVHVFPLQYARASAGKLMRMLSPPNDFDRKSRVTHVDAHCAQLTPEGQTMDSETDAARFAHPYVIDVLPRHA